MTVLPAKPALAFSPTEMTQLLARTGLSLNSGQLGDLVLGWRQIAEMIARLPRNRPLADDLAFVLRAPPLTQTAPDTRGRSLHTKTVPRGMAPAKVQRPTQAAPQVTGKRPAMPVGRPQRPESSPAQAPLKARLKRPLKLSDQGRPQAAPHGPTRGKTATTPSAGPTTRRRP